MNARSCQAARADLDALTAPTVALVDDFDGVHIGHQRWIAQTLAAARERDQHVAAISLDVMLPGQLWQRSFLTLPGVQRRMLTELGCEVALYCELHSEADCEHLSRLLHQARHIDSIVIAQSFARHAPGRTLIDALVQGGKPVGYAPISAYHNDIAITNRRIRNHLLDGDLALVRACMGRDFEIAGVVEHGQQMGQQLGFPTANIRVDPRQLLPPVGGYATFVWDGATRFMAATNIGRNPSVGGHNLTLEAHLLDFDGDLYGKRLRAEFVERLGDERRFGDRAALKAYIRESVEKTRKILQARE